MVSRWYHPISGTVCGEGWSIKKAVLLTLNRHVFLFHWCRKFRVDSQMTHVWQNCIPSLLFSSKAWFRAWWNPWMFSCLIPWTLNQITVSVLSLLGLFLLFLRVLWLFVTSIAVTCTSPFGLYCSVLLLVLQTFNSALTLMYPFILKLISVVFPPTHLSLLSFLLTHL